MGNTALVFWGEPRGFTNEHILTNNNVLRDYIDLDAMNGPVDIFWLFRDHWVDPTGINQKFIDRHGVMRECDLNINVDVIHNNIQTYIEDCAGKVDRSFVILKPKTATNTVMYGSYVRDCLEHVGQYDSVIFSRSDQFLIRKTEDRVRPMVNVYPEIEFLYSDIPIIHKDENGSHVVAWQNADLVRMNQKFIPYVKAFLHDDNQSTSEGVFPLACLHAQSADPSTKIRHNPYYRVIRRQGDSYY